MKDRILIIILGLIFSLISHNSFGQIYELTPQERKEIKQLLRQNESKKVDKKLNHILKKFPTCQECYLYKGGHQYKMALFEEAIISFEQAINLGNPPSEAYYALALAYEAEQDWLSSAQNYELYVLKEVQESEKKDKARAKAKTLKFRHEAISNPVPFQPILLGQHINTTSSEYSPCISFDDKTIIFTRYTGNENLYFAPLEASETAQSIALSDLNDPNLNQGNQTISADGKYLVFSSCNRKDAFGSCDLYYSMVLDGKWTLPTNMGHVVNSAAWDAHPCLTPDGNGLYFSSNRLGTLGGKDIWYTYRDDLGRWQKPINLGPVINSVGDDETPFLHPDNLHLFFRSNGHIGLGNHDLFVSSYDPISQQWTGPKNLGYPINTEGEEGGLVVALDGKTGYFSTFYNYMTDQLKKDRDIYKFELPLASRPHPVAFLVGDIIDKYSLKKIKSHVRITRLSDNAAIYNTYTQGDGKFLCGIPTVYDYGLFIQADGYMPYSTHFALPQSDTAYIPSKITIPLIPLKNEINQTNNAPQEEVVLKNIFFETGSAMLQSKSYVEIKNLAEYLKAHPTITILISGHTDNVGNEVDNQNLSEARAKSVIDALIQQGIDSIRLSSKGYGETQPLYDNSTEEGRSKNRRTSFRVISQ